MEVLVVILLMAVTVSFVVVNLGPDDREKVRVEASRLAASIQQAQDEAVMTGTTLAWIGEGDSYHYLRRGPGGDWILLAGEDAFFAAPASCARTGRRCRDGRAQARHVRW